MIYIKKILIFLCLFFLFNTLEIDSDSDKQLIYDKKNIHEESNHIVYFRNTNSNELRDITDILNIRILSYIIDGKKYYARDIDELENIYLKDKSLSEKIYYEDKGIYIDGINIVCENNELIKLENLIDIL